MSVAPNSTVKTSIKTKADSSTEHFTYDANGNRASATINGTSTTASYTLDDALNVYGDNTYRYDEDGYLKEKVTPNGTTTYSYGTRGELLSVSTPAKNITYQHNANNQRVAKLVNGQIVEKYLWADLTTLLAIYDKDDNLKQRFAYADQRMPVSMTQGNDTYYLHYDQVGSLRAVSDTSHTIVKEITYDTYGNILNDSNPSFKVPFGFAGGLYDAETKLTRFGYRDYDAYTGKWTAKDPIGFQGGDSNLYRYVLGDPVGLVDPSGLVDENYIDPDGYSNTILHYSGKTINYKNIYTILSHGYNGHLIGVSIYTLIDNAKKSGKDKIQLLACNQNASGDAQTIATESGLPVIYNEGTVHLLPYYGGISLSKWKIIYPEVKK